MFDRTEGVRSGARELIALAGSAASVSAAPQTFNAALPVAEGEFVFREQGFYARASDDPSPADREVEVPGAISVLGYGVTPDLAAFGVLPVLDKELEVTTPASARVTRDAIVRAGFRINF